MTMNYQYLLNIVLLMIMLFDYYNISSLFKMIIYWQVEVEQIIINICISQLP